MFPDETVCKVLGEQPAIDDAELAVDVVDGDVVGPPPELELPQPATATVAAASAANPIATRFNVGAPYPRSAVVTSPGTLPHDGLAISFAASSPARCAVL
jgi:hypothetical protein